MTEYLLEMQNITKVYDNGIVANKDINFNLKKGEIHALVGENGAGKSTLMKILFGMEKPSSGKMYLNGKELVLSSSKEAIAHNIGMVHQHFMLVDSFTVASNIMLGIEPTRALMVNAKESLRFTREICEKYNLEVDAEAITGNLPVGIKQKIEILKALARGAKILILDEPTAVLTPQETDQLFDELINLKNQGHTIIFISHKLVEVKKISDRITVMRAGLYEGTFDTKTVSEKEISNKIVGWELDDALVKGEMSEGSNGITIKNLTCLDEDETPIVNNVSFTVPKGAIIGIAGVQGNGQVELVEMLTASRKIKQGTVQINDKDVSLLNEKTLRDTGFGYIPEDRLLQGLSKENTIKENIISNMYKTGMFSKKGFLSSKKITEFADDCVKKYKIKCKNSNDKIGALSGGNMQKVVVARECEHMPTVLIAEQPTRGVDIGAALIIHEKLVELRDKGSAVLLVSADLTETMKLSDKLLVMYEGEIVAYYDDMSKVTEEELGLCMLGSKKHTEEEIGRAYNG